MNDQANFFAMIPNYVLRNRSLSASDKLVYGEISSLTNAKGYCWATNKYLAEVLGMQSNSISRCINHLKTAGYVVGRLIYKKGTKEIEKRYLTLKMPEFADECIDTNDDKSDTPINRTEDTPINSTVKTPINPTVKERIKGLYVVVIGGSKVELSDEHPLAHYQRAWGRPATGLNNEKIVEFADYFGNELTNYAFDKAALSGHEYSYAVAILHSWHDKGIKTVADAVADEQRHKQQSKSKPAKQQHEQQATPTKTRTKTEAIYKALQVNAGDVDRTLDYFATDGLQITREEIETVADERIRA